MKKLLCILIAFITLSACKKDEKNASIHSTWELTKEDVYYKNTLTDSYYYPNYGKQSFITFNQNGEYFESEFQEGSLNEADSSPFTITGNKITLSSNVDIIEYENTYEINGNTLIITYIDGDYKIVLTFKLSERNVKADYDEYSTWK